MQMVALLPSEPRLAPQPPPMRPPASSQSLLVSGMRPFSAAESRSAWWPAMTRSGMACAMALKMVSTMVIGKVIHQRIGEGLTAETTRPIGRMIFNGRKLPSLIGFSSGEVRHLNATWQQAMPAASPEL